MKKQVIISSIITIALCISLIAGSTFALFTSTSQVNVAVTSGKVSVTATASGLEHGSTLGQTLSESTATLIDNTITLDKMVPGDFVTFTITIHNNSDVTVKYKTIFTKLSGDTNFFNALKITVDQQPAEDVPSVADLGDAAPAVATPAGTMLPGCEDIILNVKVELPESAGNEHQEKSCSFAYIVESVQGNADLPADRVYVSSIEEINAAIAAGATNLALIDDISVTATGNTADDAVFQDAGWGYYIYVDGKDITLDLNGHDMTIDVGTNSKIGSLVSVFNNGTFTLQGEGTVTTKSSSKSAGANVIFVSGSGTCNIYDATLVNDMLAEENGITYEALIYVKQNDGESCVANIYSGKFVYPAQTAPCDGNSDNNTNCFNVRNYGKGHVYISEGVMFSCEKYKQSWDNGVILLDIGCELQEVNIDGTIWYKVVRSAE